MVQGEIVLELTGNVWLSQEKIKDHPAHFQDIDGAGWGQSSHEDICCKCPHNCTRVYSVCVCVCVYVCVCIGERACGHEWNNHRKFVETTQR